YYRVQQHRIEILQDIPNEHAVEMLLGIVQSLLQEVFDPARIGLLGVLLAKGFAEDRQEILGIKAVTQLRDEADVFLGSAAQIQNRKTALIANVAEELFQTPAGPRFDRHLSVGLGAVTPSAGRSRTMALRSAARRFEQILQRSEHLCPF